MYFLKKSFILFFICLIIQKYLCSDINSNVAPLKESFKLPNGPVDLPSDKTINTGSKKYQYDLEKENSDNSLLEDEIKEDMTKLEDVIKKVDIPLEEPEYYTGEPEINYDFPPWLTEMITLSNKSKNTLESLGVENLPNIKKCEEIKILKEQLLCITDGLEEIKDVYTNAKDITSLTSRVLAGGRMAIKALIRLKTLASSYTNRTLMKSLGLPMVILIMIQRETTSDRDRWLGGSVLTLLTDLPVITDLADVKTGSYGHVNVIMPRQSRVRRADRNILSLREGASPSSLINGYTTTQV